MELDKTGLTSLLFEGLEDSDGRRFVYMSNMKTGVSRWSKSGVEYFGMPSEYMENAGDIWMERVHPEDREMYARDIEAVFSGKKKTHRLDYRVRNKDGEYLVCTCRGNVIYDDATDTTYFLGTIENHGVSDYIDSTSGLYNVYGFLKDAADYRLKEDAKDILMIVGVNHFSDINKMYGYAYGNKVIKQFVEKLRGLVTEKDRIYRMDGVKFVIALRGGNYQDAVRIYEGIKRVAHEGFNIDQNHVSFTVAGGVVMVDDKAVNEYSIQASLGYVIDQSKYEKHGEFVVFSGEDAADTGKNLAKMDAIRNSIFADMDGFYLCYQPIIDVEKNSVSGMEALLRWNKEPFGEVPPGVFIPWLENDPCFYTLGQWVMKQALIDGKKLLDKYPDFIVNVNVSAEQIERKGFRQSVEDILNETEFPARNLCIELTERVISLDTQFLRGELEYFKSRGIKIALDDFGTGISSLSLLLELPVDYLKIDRNFVKEISTNVAEQVIVETIALCADGMKMDVCVEGVETEEMKEFLKRYHIRKHQGYYYSRPVRFEAFCDYIEHVG